MEYKALWVHPSVHKKIKGKAEKDKRTINDFLDSVIV